MSTHFKKMRNDRFLSPNLMFQYCHNFCQFSHDQIAKHMSEKLKIYTTVLYIILIYNTTTAVSLNKSQNTRDNWKQKDTN
jgi:hypothetical protein